MTTEECKGMARTMLLVAACFVFVGLFAVLLSKYGGGAADHHNCRELGHG